MANKSLPCEILHQILENENLQISDVINFALTCKRFYATVVTSNNLWRTKFFQRWPFLREEFENLQTQKDGGNQSLIWWEETKARIMCRKRLMEKLEQMSAKHYKTHNLLNSDFKEFDPLFLPECGASPMSYHYLTDELVSLIEKPHMESNLTLKYYAYKVVRYVRQNYLTKEWNKFVALPAKYQTAERGAVLVAQWGQPEKRVSARKISDMLDKISQETKAFAADSSNAEIARWKKEILYDNVWNNEDSIKVFETLCVVMSYICDFRPNSCMHNSSANWFIDQVLERKIGTPILITIIFESVARRLGLHLEHITFNNTYLMRWKERYIPKCIKDNFAEFHYIDILRGVKVFKKEQGWRKPGTPKCLVEKYNREKAMTAVQMVQKIAEELGMVSRYKVHPNGRTTRWRSALELHYLVALPEHRLPLVNIAIFSTTHGIDHMELIDTNNNMSTRRRIDLQHLMKIIYSKLKTTNAFTKTEKVLEISRSPKTRNSRVRFAVGMIMKDQQSNLCVIIDWDNEYDYRFEHKLPESARTIYDQPYYHIYVETGSSYYVPQDYLLLNLAPSWINYDEIGRYFCKFTGTHFLPNKEKAREYPEDAKFLNKIYEYKDE